MASAKQETSMKAASVLVGRVAAAVPRGRKKVVYLTVTQVTVQSTELVCAVGTNAGPAPGSTA